MTLLAALWLALLHALAPAPIAGPAWGAVAPRSAAAVVVMAQETQAPSEALRAERVAARVMVARVAQPAPPAPSRSCLAASEPDLAHRAARAPPAGCGRSYAVAASGGVRPYYPTAPPLQG
ncbi:hypothetical protein J421_4781 (plasmid) [Gemmatirosa kalamazoonensis]|uniref:Uncharacterized protein n=1 Tax=Gemmatirosa kalamazoonensis TaxID=861299 RepID=W0RNK0_9BACT|nr:hypothetical protein [Gemmatirosa kalamazoonensis]AHG92316.1 hypothetical protein J421_4781 [Gemmatirosa kalamazoonensis]